MLVAMAMSLISLSLSLCKVLLCIHEFMRAQDSSNIFDPSDATAAAWHNSSAKIVMHVWRILQ